MNLSLLEENLLAPGIVKEILYFDEIDSTNDAELKPGSDDVLIIAGHQKSGRGRLGREWISGSGDITFSLVKNFSIPAGNTQLVNFYSAYIIYTSLNSITEGKIHLSLKWPNDILANGKKVCGLLLSVKNINFLSKRFIIGAGINVNTSAFPAGIKSKAASLFSESGITYSREEIISDIVSRFYMNLDLLDNGKDLVAKWKKSSGIINKEVSFKELSDSREYKAKVIDIAPSGGIILKLESGTVKTFHNGEISLGYDYTLK